MRKFRWGILGTGTIAKAFARGIDVVDDAEVAAVASRSAEKSKAFSQEFNVPTHYDSYEQLARDESIDAVYVATPHTLHKENTLLCLNNGRAVLCEKPLAINSKEVESMIKTSQQTGNFLMEAHWTRCFPIMGKIRQLIDEKAIGEIRMLQADFGFRVDLDPENRLFNPKLAGGALLDVGCYTFSAAHMCFGKPQEIRALAHIGRTRVDEQNTVILGYEEGALAVLVSANRTSTFQELMIYGTEGKIKVDSPFWKPSSMTLYRDNKFPEPIEMDIVGNGYNYEAIEVMACVRAGKLESLLVSHQDSLEIMNTLDAVRSLWGLKYPME